MTQFSGLDLVGPLRRAVAAAGYSAPTPIQAQSIPPLLERHDLLGIAQTGTGKTAAFVLPILQHLSGAGSRPAPGAPRALILAPTRELAGQIQDSIRAYGRHLPTKGLAIFGGVPIGRQIKALNRPVDVLVATPGRLLDLMNQKCLRLDAVTHFVLDEADRMLDMGFIHDVRKISAKLPTKRQTILFSATMPKAVQSLADGLLRDPVRIEIAPRATTAERIDQRVLFVPKQKKRDLLSRLLGDSKIRRVLVFTRTKHGADRVARHLAQRGVPVAAIHGNKSQNARLRALNGFRSGQIRALVATDIAARGIDVDDVTHVINFDLPNDPESYVHRIGRTARGGAAGVAISFCDASERAYLRDIEKTIRRAVPVDQHHPYHDSEAPEDTVKPFPSRKPGPARKGRPRRRKPGRSSRPRTKVA